MHDALRRRCLFHWIDCPDFAKEYDIVRRKAPAATELLARQVVGFVQELRRQELYKAPGVAETLDWIAALVALDQQQLDEVMAGETLGALLKYREDVEQVRRTALPAWSVQAAR